MKALLKRIIRALPRRTASTLELTVPTRTNLLIIGQSLSEVIDLYSKKIKLKECFEEQAINRHIETEQNCECDKFANLKVPTAPEPAIGMCIDVLCDYDDDANNSDIIRWSQ